MKFGSLYELMPGRPPWPEGRERQVYHEALEQIILSEELGFDYVWAVEHHFLTGYSSSSAPEAFLAWVAGQTSRIRIGHGVVQLSKPMNHAVRVAERVAALDIMSNGRVEFGSGRGFTQEEVVSFGIDPSETRPMQLEAMRMLPRMWVEDEFEFHNRFYDVPKRTLHPKPIQTPHPPMWMAVTQPDTWRIAGELGAGVLAFGFADPAALQAAMDSYREAIAVAERPYGVVNEQIAFAPPLYCCETDEEALETAAPHVLWFLECNFRYVNQWADTDAKDYEFYKQVGTDILALPVLTDDEKRGLSEEAAVMKAAVKANLFCIGSPDTCREFVRHYDDVGIDQMLFLQQIGSLTNEQIQNSMKLFAKEVMPEFQG